MRASKSRARLRRPVRNSRLYSFCGSVMVPLHKNAMDTKALTQPLHCRMAGLMRRLASVPVCPNNSIIRATCSGSFTLNSLMGPPSRSF